MSIKQAIEALELALPFMEEQATTQGYGFYRPANPHNFFPDPESCTEAEIENHRAACEAYDEGKFVPDNSDGWVSPNLHILKAPWGIGSYTDTIPEIQAQCDKARAALAALRSMPQGEPVALPRTNSIEASAMIDSVLAGYDWPTNPKNAARAGFEACLKLLASAPTPEPMSAPTEAKPAQQGDAELLDWLEAQINEHGAIHLHDGSNPNGHGLGLRPGSLNRTLRDAIRAAISAKKA